ncbi:MAG TPA: hypothetical protein DD490_20475 [Acidobacteria bacterium]|nr:hypothetical protein [Acidobacteriota bacterium]
MNTPLQKDDPNLPSPLRLWPGVVAVCLLWLARFGLKALIPGFRGFSLGMMWALGAALAVVVWWVFFSRAGRLERWGGLALMPLAMGATWLLRHESMGLLWLLGYAVPGLCLALVAGAALGRRFAVGPRRATLAAALLLGSGAWALVRTDGINGDHVADFSWRWAKSPEEQLLAQAEEPAAPGSPSPREQTAAPPGAEPVAPPVETPAEAPATPTAAEPAVPQPDAQKAAEARPAGGWPGFRGPGRDGTVSGVRIATDWTASPPVELWRRPVGPGWSSFAVHGNRIYTQEQRGDDEVVTCYDAGTGEPVWVHRDATRFFESNAGAGPRGTPTLSDGRVYTFGATGILNALDAGSGAVVWSRNAATDTQMAVPDWGFSSSPLVIDDLVLVAAAGRLIAYDRATGTPRWLGPADGVSYSSPQRVTIAGVPQVLLLSESGAASFAPADGRRLWEHAWKGFPIVQPAVLADGGVLLAASSQSGTRRLAVAHGPGGWTVAERWTSAGLKPYFNDFVVHGGHAFGFDGRILACIALADGERTWKGGRYGNGQLVLLPDQDLLLVLSEEGELALVQATPDKFTELARFPAIQGKTWNHPVLVGDLLLVRNDQEMAAFRLPLAGA